MESNRGQAHASSSSRPPRSSSPIRGDSRGFRAVCSDVQRKLRDFYTFDLMPKTFTIKFRQRVEGLQLGANFEVNNQNLSVRLCFGCRGLIESFKYPNNLIYFMEYV